MKFVVTAQRLEQVFPGFQLDFEALAETLNLDLGHVQLLKDGFSQWPEAKEMHALVLLCLVHTVNQGSLCLHLADPLLGNLLYEQGLTNTTDDCLNTDWAAMTIHQQPVLVLHNQCLYWKKYYQAEQQLSADIHRLIKQYSGGRYTAEQIGEVVGRLVDELTFAQVEDKQIQAMAVCLLQPFSIISGGPGTGKTTIMLSVLRGLQALGVPAEDMVLAAPTGRAAYRMTESIRQGVAQDLRQITAADQALCELEATTLHRLLGARVNRGGFRLGAHNHLRCRVLVVDEVSMVDIMMMRQLMSAVPNDCRVILLGDQFQLPSVNAGAVLSDLMPPVEAANRYSQKMYDDLNQALSSCPERAQVMSGLNIEPAPQLLTDRVTVLAVSKRCQPAIAAASECVRQGQANAFLKQLNSGQAVKNMGVHWLSEAMTTDQWRAFYLHWLSGHYRQDNDQFKRLLERMDGFDPHHLETHKTTLGALFTCINLSRILTFVNDTELGTRRINEVIVQWMKHWLNEPGMDDRFHGAVVMLQHNNHALNVYNGDVALLLRASGGQLRAVLPQGNGFQSHSVHVLPAFTAAYAMTVHKSQGSEFAHVLIPVPDHPGHRLMCREILYTGMTRAKQSVTLSGSEEALRAATKKQTNRHSGLSFWYNQNH